jgi:hypothetical protein
MAAAEGPSALPREWDPQPLIGKGFDSSDRVEEVHRWVDKQEWADHDKRFAKLATARFLRARKGDFDRTTENLTETVDWRATNLRPEAWMGRYTATLHEFCFLPIGLDKARRPVIYGCPARASNDEVNACVAHVAMDLEHAFRLEDHPDPAVAVADRWVWVVDFNGFGFKHAMNPTLGRRFVSMFDRHFPERLGLLVLLDPPMVFSILLGALKPFLDEATASKIVSVSTSEIGTKLSEFLQDETVDWLDATCKLDAVPGNLPFPLPAGSYWSHPVEEKDASIL